MPDPTASLDSQFTRLAIQQDVMDHAMSLDAPSAQQVAALQKQGGLKEGLEYMTTRSIVHVGSELAEQLALGAPKAAVGAFTTLYTLAAGWQRAWNEGHAINDAYQRDAVTLAIIETGSAALPATYVSKMMNDYRDVAGIRGGANKVLTAAMTSGQWDELKAGTEASIKAGLDFADKAKLTTPEALAARLQADRAFATRYHQDTAFRVGIQSVIYEKSI